MYNCLKEDNSASEKNIGSLKLPHIGCVGGVFQTQQDYSTFEEIKKTRVNITRLARVMTAHELIKEGIHCDWRSI